MSFWDLKTVFLERLALDINPIFKENKRSTTVFLNTNDKQFSNPMTCFYCMRKGHSLKNCKIRKFDVPKGLVSWVPKSITNTSGPKFNRVPMPQT